MYGVIRKSFRFFFRINFHSNLTLCAKTFAGQYANKRRGANEDGGLFVTANYWGFLPDSRLNDCTEQQNGKLRNICIGEFKITRRMPTGYANLMGHR